ncbi:MAG: DNA/RNA non-specific endonuclease [Lachnospiraceae bacterium]|nr:DNA/RNA non-specific endonuclease [Lachnospiraceae bacterium]
MPRGIVRKLWGNLPRNLNFLKPVAVAVLFLVAVFTIPLPEEDSYLAETQQSGEVLDEIAGEDTAIEGSDVAAVGEEATGDKADEASGEDSTASQNKDDTPWGEEIDATGVAEDVSLLTPEETAQKILAVIAEGLPAYTGDMFTVIHDNVPYFEAEEMTDVSYEYYSPLDDLGRCGPCVASIGRDIMPTEDRGAIGSVKPSGWNQAKYTGVVDGAYLYNRAHLIGHQLTGEDANVCNLITGTRYFNTEGMLPFENMVADYIKETGNHVMYRVTPVFEGDNLVATGVLMEAKSVEDDGEGILFCVYCYNVQPGVTIDYSDGSSELTDGG